MKIPRLFLRIAIACVMTVAGAAPAAAEGVRYAVIVQGASGDPQYASLHRGWVDGLARVLREQIKLEAQNLFILAEQPKAPELRSTAENVKAALGRFAQQTTTEDLVFVMLIGHGSGDGAAAKFNLVGPDLTAEEWNAALKPVTARIVVVDSTSSSFPFLAGLAAPNRIVITATNSFAQRYHTVFPDAFIRALGAAEADADKNGRISMLEAFTHASRLVALHYEQSGTMATERAMIDDTGNGKGRDASAAGPDGEIAAFTFLDVVSVPKVGDPEVQQLLVRQQALTDQVDELRRRKSTMTQAEFDLQFETLVIELSLVSREVRRRTAR